MVNDIIKKYNLKKWFYTIVLIIAFALLIFSMLNNIVLISGITLILYSIIIICLVINLVVCFFFLNTYIWRDSDWEKQKNPNEATRFKITKKIRNFTIIEKNQLFFGKIKNLGEFCVYYFLMVDLFIHTIPGYWHLKNNSENIIQNTHDAIVICNKCYIVKTSYGYGFGYLIHFFKKNNYSYKIYECESCEEFENILMNPSVTSLWIFGHGTRGGVSIGNTFYDYSQIRNKNLKKDYIYQFHCNPGLERSLASIVSDGRGYVNNKINSSNSNFWNTYEILKSFNYDNNRIKRE